MKFHLLCLLVFEKAKEIWGIFTTKHSLWRVLNLICLNSFQIAIVVLYNWWHNFRWSFENILRWGACKLTMKSILSLWLSLSPPLYISRSTTKARHICLLEIDVDFDDHSIAVSVVFVVVACLMFQHSILLPII